VTITIPPLRERREDIPLLIHFFMQSAAERYAKEIEGITPGSAAGADELLLARQRAAIEERGGEHGRPLARPKTGRRQPAPRDPPRQSHRERFPRRRHEQPCRHQPEQAEKELIRNTLKLTNGNREQAAKILEIARADALS
jgi:transcriptional regulator with PAS, ATPase and Fis domain